MTSDISLRIRYTKKREDCVMDAGKLVRQIRRYWIDNVEYMKMTDSPKQ